MTDDEAAIHWNKMPGKIYISPAVTTAEGPLRIASQVIDHPVNRVDELLP